MVPAAKIDGQAAAAVPANRSTQLRLALRAALFAALYLVAMVGAIEVARFGGRVSPIWLASAILAWALINAATRDWPLVLGFTAVAHVIGGLIVGDQLDREAVYMIANLISPVCCALMLRLHGDNLAFESRGAVIRFLIIAGVLSPALSSAMVGLRTMFDPGGFSPSDAGTWFLSDGLSMVVFLPIFRSLASGGLRDLASPAKRTRAAALFGGLIIAHAIGWFTPPALHNFFTILLVPYVIYIAFELGETGARAAVALSAIVLISYSLVGGAGPNMHGLEYVIAVQVYVAALASSVLPLAAALSEKQRLYETVSEALSDTQAAWGQLIAAEAHYRLIADNTTEMILRLGRDGVIVFASPACKLLSADVERLTGRPITALANKDDVPRIRREIANFAGEAVYDRPHTMRLRLRDANDVYHDFDARLTLVSARLGEGEEFIAVLREVGT